MTRPERTDSVDDSLASGGEFSTDVVLHDGGHLFDGERCVYCNVNTYDIGIYPDAPALCPVPREPLNYMTETPRRT